MASVDGKITNEARKYISEFVCNHMYQLREERLRSIFDTDDKGSYDSWIGDLAKLVFTKMQAVFADLQRDASLLASGKIHEEVKRIIGQIHVTGKTVSMKNLPGFETKMLLVKELYQCFKGKAIAGRSRKRSHTEAQASTEGVAQAGVIHNLANYDAPSIHLLRPAAIDFLPAPRLGEGAFAYVCKVNVKDIAFPDEIYAAKCIKQGDGVMNAEQLAMHEATNIPFQHMGIISPIGLARRENHPMVLYKYWNGGHMDQWMQMLKNDPSRPMAKDFLDTPGNPALFLENIFQIINGLLQTIEFMHYHDFMHNDLHGQNILLHFGQTGVYVGIADWGRASYYPTTTRFPSLPDALPSTKLAWITRYKHVAPECFSENPPPYSKPQEIYSLSHQIKRLLDSLAPIREPLLAHFVSNMYRKVQAGLENNPDKRPDAFTLSCCIQGIHNFGVNIVKSSGLRPIDD